MMFKLSSSCCWLLSSRQASCRAGTPVADTAIIAIVLATFSLFLLFIFLLSCCSPSHSTASLRPHPSKKCSVFLLICGFLWSWLRGAHCAAAVSGQPAAARCGGYAQWKSASAAGFGEQNCTLFLIGVGVPSSLTGVNEAEKTL